MNKADRIQLVFDTCIKLFESGKPITVAGIYESTKIHKITISDDLRFLKPLVTPNGKHWVMTKLGISASKTGDVFKALITK